MGSYLCRKIPASGYVPSQRFSRSQGFFPPATCQPCFMLVPPLGFLPSGSISTHRAVHPLGCRCPPGVQLLVGFRLDHHGCVGYRGTLASMPAVSRRCLHQSMPLQGFAPCECPLLRVNCLSQPGSATLLGFLLLGDFSCSAGDLPEVHPL